MGKTKQLTCIDCNTVFEGSLFANPAVARCPVCKKNRKAIKNKVGVDKSTIQDGVMNQIKNNVVDSKPIQIRLIRNRQEIEGHVVMDSGEVIERVPAQWDIVQGKIDYLSVSKLTSYDNCPRKFYEQVLNVTDPSIDNGNKFSWFGTILHEVMEVVEKAWVENGIMLDPLTCYDDAWRRQPLTDLTTYHEGRELIKDYFDRHPIGQMPYRTVATELEWRGKVSELFGDVPDELKDIDFGAQLDYVGEIDAETAILRDYKSNRIPYTPSQLEESLQLRVYEIIARKLYPQYKKWITGYEMFRFGWQQCPNRTEEDLEETKAYVINTAMQIVHHREWSGKLNGLCTYCSYKNECPQYLAVLENPNDIIQSIVTDKTDLSSVEGDREKLTAIEKIVKARKDELSEMIKAEVTKATMGGQSLVIDGKELYLQAQSRPSYDYYSAKQIALVYGASDVLDKCVTINKTKLDKALKENPQLALEMTKCIKDGYSSPYLMKKKATKKAIANSIKK